VNFAVGSVMFHRTHTSESAGYDLRLCEGWQIALRMWGHGSVDHVHRLVDDLNELDRTYPSSPLVTVAVDLSGAVHAPLRVQLILGRWLVQKRHRVGKMAVFGGPPLPMKIARAVCAIARLHKVAFVDAHDDAVRFLVVE
jgi:hypothetical protein